MNELLSIVAHFHPQGTVNEIRPLGSGLINDTYKVITAEADAPDYVLQRINHAIFQDVDGLQRNIEAVTGHRPQGAALPHDRQRQDVLEGRRCLLARDGLHPPRQDLRDGQP